MIAVPLATVYTRLGGDCDVDEDLEKKGILVLAEDDPERELDFELAYLRSLTTQQRFDLMFRRSREMAEMLTRYGHREPVAIIERS